MRLITSDTGSIEDSKKLFNYLIYYLNDLSISLRSKDCHIMADAIDKQMFNAKKQYAEITKSGKILTGWNSI